MLISCNKWNCLGMESHSKVWTSKYLRYIKTFTIKSSFASCYFCWSWFAGQMIVECFILVTRNYQQAKKYIDFKYYSLKKLTYGQKILQIKLWSVSIWHCMYCADVQVILNISEWSGWLKFSFRLISMKSWSYLYCIITKSHSR